MGSGTIYVSAGPAFQRTGPKFGPGPRAGNSINSDSTSTFSFRATPSVPLHTKQNMGNLRRSCWSEKVSQGNVHVQVVLLRGLSMCPRGTDQRVNLLCSADSDLFEKCSNSRTKAYLCLYFETPPQFRAQNFNPITHTISHT